MREGSFVQDTSNPSYASSNIPQSTEECLFDNSFMTEDAWKVLNMIEYANNACSREYPGYSFGSASAGTTRDYFSSKISQAAGKAAKPKIWSIEDIIVKEREKVTSHNSSSARGDFTHGCPYRSKQSTKPNNVVLSDYGYLGVNNYSSHNQQQLDQHLVTRIGPEPAGELVSQLLLQEMVGGYCCSYTEQLYIQEMYYQCIYCHQIFSNAHQLHQHQIVQHPLIN